MPSKRWRGLALGAVLVGVCSCGGDDEVEGESSQCQSMIEQICTQWKNDGASAPPCDPPLTAPTDYNAVCEKADQLCQADAKSIRCD